MSDLGSAADGNARELITRYITALQRRHRLRSLILLLLERTQHRPRLGVMRPLSNCYSHLLLGVNEFARLT